MEADEIVSARLQSVLPAAPAAVRQTGRPITDDGPLRWKDLIPSWPDDADPAHRDTGGDPPSGPSVSAWTSLPYAWEMPAAAGPPEPDPGDPDSPPSAAADGAAGTGGSRAPLSAAGAFGSAPAGERRAAWLSRFDPGRRGARALAAVAAVVVLVAALWAWRSRPRVDPVAEPPAAPTVRTAAGDRAGEASGNGAGAGPHPSAAEVVVAVAGKVRHPGLVRLPSGSRVADALEAAGGVSAGVDVAMLNPARKVIDGELIAVGVTPPPGTGTAADAGTGPAGGSAAVSPINLNTATLADLDSLPGVGPVLAQRILDARAAQGGFRTVSDLRKVDGIGDARYEQLKDMVVV
jgi:competence protein ComEA